MKGKLKKGDSKAPSFKISIKISGNKVQNVNPELVKETIAGSEIIGSKTAGQGCNSFAYRTGISLGIATRLQIKKHI